jgi:hypothetical protein
MQRALGIVAAIAITTGWPEVVERWSTNAKVCAVVFHFSRRPWAIFGVRLIAFW